MRDYTVAQQQLSKRNYPPLPALSLQADDAGFLRRACIDLAGILPGAEDVRAFLASSYSYKRALLTDDLVKEAGAAEV